MKIKSILTGALALGLASSAFAQTDITITGATAFRQAAMLAIYNAYNSIGGGLGNNFNVAHDFPGNAGNELGQLIASNKAIFRGTFPGISGETIVRTSFNGSVEGLRAIAFVGNGTNNASVFQVQSIGGNITADFDGSGGLLETIRPKFSFSDVFQSSSPVPGTLNFGNATNSRVGVVTFTMLASESAPSGLNVTQQQYKALLQQGVQPLRLFTGNTTDTTKVLATGRNDGSGTRTTYLAEIGFGIANPVQQYVATTAGASVNGTISAVTVVPLGGTGTGNLATSGGASNNSNVWGNNAVGNGGYSSGSTLRDHMARTTASVDVYDGIEQDPIYTEPVILMTFLSTADASNAIGNGAKIVSFNGVTVDPSGGIDATEKARVTNGQYSAWSYQHLYNHGSLSTNENEFRFRFFNTWLNPALVTTANGIVLGDMSASRPGDGSPIVSPL